MLSPIDKILISPYLMIKKEETNSYHFCEIESLLSMEHVILFNLNVILSYRNKLYSIYEPFLSLKTEPFIPLIYTSLNP